MVDHETPHKDKPNREKPACISDYEPHHDRLRAFRQLDPILFSRVKLLILVYLTGVRSTSFTELRKGIDATDGNLFVHLNKLCDRKFVRKHYCTKRRAETRISITTKGKNALYSFGRLLQLGICAEGYSSD